LLEVKAIGLYHPSRGLYALIGFNPTRHFAERTSQAHMSNMETPFEIPRWK